MSRSLRDVYETLVLDCPAGISLLSENVLRAADAIVVPILPSPLSVRMLTQLQEFVIENDWSDLAVLPFFSMVDRRKSLHREMIDSAREQFPELLTTEVPYWSDIERIVAASSAAARVCPRQCRRPGLRSALAGNREPDRRPPARLAGPR